MPYKILKLGTRYVNNKEKNKTKNTIEKKKKHINPLTLKDNNAKTKYL